MDTESGISLGRLRGSGFRAVSKSWAALGPQATKGHAEDEKIYEYEYQCLQLCIAATNARRPPMTTSCPFRHVSYTSWRYQALRSLFQSANELPTAPAILPRPGLLPNDRRKLSSSAQAHSRNVGSLREEQKATRSSVVEASQGYYTKGLGLYSTRGGLKTGESDEHDGGKKLKGSYVTKKWSPLDEEGKEDLQALADSLQEASEDPYSTPGVHDATSGHEKLSDRLPQSPLVRALDREKPQKQKSKGIYKNELVDNPWARMLASPIRYCSVTGVRLPSDLLVPWGLVRKPGTQDVYFMPAELAELDELKDKRGDLQKASSSTTQPGSHERSSSAQSPLIATESDVDSAFTGNDKGIRPSSNCPDSAAYLRKVNILPLQSLLQHLTLKHTFINKKTGKRESMLNVVGRMVPWRWNQALERARFYGERRRIAAGNPSLNKAERSDVLVDFKHVKWDPEIDHKMLRILRERVLTALEALGRRNQKLWEQGKELVKTKPVAPGAQLPAMFEDEDIFTVANNEVKEHYLKSARMCLVIEVSHYEKINSGAEADMQVEKRTRRDNTRAIEPSGVHVGASYQVPVFSLTDLFDQDYMMRFLELTRTIGVLAPREWTAAQGSDYSLVFPATAHGADVVFAEVWRLFRYMGWMSNTA